LFTGDDWNEMHMVGHQHPGPDLDVRPPRLDGEEIALEPVVVA
jgi:hypothetical protein